jgi:threonyl-tRNA synthetase
MGEAIERLYGGHLCYGPPIENGFYYDVFMCGCGHDTDQNELSSVSTSHFNSIETSMKSICNEKQPFERLELTKDELIEMFSYNQFKVRILKEKIKEDRTTVYRCGTLIDLCRGPHVRHTGNVKALKVTKVSILLYYKENYFISTDANVCNKTQTIITLVLILFLSLHLRPNVALINAFPLLLCYSMRIVCLFFQY